jgi:hypothetical protein
MKTTLAVIAMVTLAATAGAQVIVHEQQSKAGTEQHLQLTWETAPSTGVHLSVATATVTGAPYTGSSGEPPHGFTGTARVARGAKRSDPTVR